MKVKNKIDEMLVHTCPWIDFAAFALLGLSRKDVGLATALPQRMWHARERGLALSYNKITSKFSQYL